MEVIARITDLCEHEFMSGSFSSLAGSGMMASGIENKGALVVSSAVVGGTSSMIGGGKFSNGAVTGAFTVWFNHLTHENEDYVEPPAKIDLSGGSEDIIEGILEWGEYYNWCTSTSKKDIDGNFFTLDDIFSDFGYGWSVGNTFGEVVQKDFYPNGDGSFDLNFVEKKIPFSADVRKSYMVCKICGKYKGGNATITLYGQGRDFKNGAQTNPYGKKIARFIEKIGLNKDFLKGC